MTSKGFTLGFAATTAVVSAMAGPVEAAVTFNFTTTGNAQADAGFTAAGQRWSNLLADNITVNITAGFSPLAPLVLGQANSNTVGFTYSNVRTALTGDSTSSNDATAVSHLPAGSSLSFVTNARNGSFIFDNNASGNNTTLDVNRANAKAIGLLGATDNTVSDANITFSSDFAFDFNPNDGIDADKIDFVGVATHEIGHALGFVSGVDTVDFFSGSGPGASTDLNGGASGIGTLDPFRVFSVLDLYRHTEETQSTNSGRLDFGTGGTAYTSIDGGATSIGLMSTGTFNGNGSQASHWKDNLQIGVMDPTFGFGELGVIRDADLIALDVIGYSLVPEPGALSLAVIGAAALLRRRRGSRPVTA